jgi:hypothetical protein
VLLEYVYCNKLQLQITPHSGGHPQLKGSDAVGALLKIKHLTPDDDATGDAVVLNCIILLLLLLQEGAVMMMEFGYDGKILETFTPLGIDQSKETFPMW